MTEGFLRFWTAWPKHFRKVGRSQCLAKWESRGLEAKADEIISGLEHCKRSPQWQKSGGEFIPMPMTWLNREAWEAPPAPPYLPNEASDPQAGGLQWTPREPTPEEIALIRDKPTP